DKFSRCFKVLFLYEWKSDHNSAAAARNINVDGSKDEPTIRCWYAKSESGDKSPPNEDRGWTETIVVNDVLRAIKEQNHGNIIRDYAEELQLFPGT
ncbi:hypothetical protein TNCT_385911, partial [Trichonephila clavata]